MQSNGKREQWGSGLGFVLAGLAIFPAVFVAALTSGISLQKVVTAYFIDERQWSRRGATLVFGGVIWFLGCLSAVSFFGWVWGTRNAVAEIRHGSHNFADVHLVSLLSGLKDDESHSSPVHVITLASVWGIFIRFIAPLAVLIAFLNEIGCFDSTAREEAPPPHVQEQSVTPGEDAESP